MSVLYMLHSSNGSTHALQEEEIVLAQGRFASTKACALAAGPPRYAYTDGSKLPTGICVDVVPSWPHGRETRPGPRRLGVAASSWLELFTSASRALLLRIDDKEVKKLDCRASNRAVATKLRAIGSMLESLSDPSGVSRPLSAIFREKLTADG